MTPQEKNQAERVRKAKDTLLEFQAPDGLFQKCNDCGKAVYNEDVIENYYVCPYCGSYLESVREQELQCCWIKEHFRNGMKRWKPVIR